MPGRDEAKIRARNLERRQRLEQRKIPMTPSSDWERLYTAAILETDRSKLNSRIDAAQAAIDGRLREMNADHGGSAEESLEIETAHASLRAMRKRVAMPQHSPQEKG
jgi:hypothetical protein